MPRPPWTAFPAYVPVAERRARAAKEIARLAKGKGGTAPEPVAITGRAIAETFWGKAWCDNLESYADFAHRLARGRSYVRSGAVIDLRLAEGRITARVMGSSPYEVDIEITRLADDRWRAIASTCAGQIASLVGLLRGELPDDVLRAVSDRKAGLFPEPRQFRPSCTCPDVAQVCKHVAATLYGVGARLDTKPALLFLLRGVKAEDLVDAAAAAIPTAGAGAAPLDVPAADLGAIFGIDLGDAPPAPPDRPKRPPPKTKAKKKTAKARPKR